MKFPFSFKLKHILILIGISLLIEILQIIIIKKIFRIKLLILIIELLIHYFSIFYLIHAILFSGSQKVFNRYHCWKLGVTIAETFKKQLQELDDVIKNFYSSNNNILPLDEIYNKISFLNSITDLIYSYLKISNIVDSMSNYQKNMIISLHRLKMSIDDSKIQKILEISFKEIQLKRKKFSDFKSKKFDNYLSKIQSNIKKIIIQIDDFLLKGHLFKNIINFLFNDTFGSLEQLKCELMSRFSAEEFKVKIPNKKNKLIDCLLINNPLQKKENNNNVNINNKNISKPDTVIIICNRSSCPYELFAYYDKWIECYISYGINVVLWNYRGYGESNGFCTIDNIQYDSEEIVKFIKNEFNFKNIGVHGIGFGGICAAYLVNKNLINFCFVDRCFGDLYEFINSKTLPYFSFLMKFFFVKNTNIAKLLKTNENNNDIYKVISYDITKDYIKDKVSLKTKIALDFYNTLNEIEHKKSFLETILNESENQYETFEKDISYLIKVISKNKSNDSNLKGDLNSFLINNPLNQNQNYQQLDNDLSTRIENTSTSEKTNNEKDKIYPENKVISMFQNLLLKFDSGGETLLNLIQCKSSKEKKLFLNNFFINMLTWGSFKIGQVYATDKLIAFRAISKKFAFINTRISKVIENPQKYILNDNDLVSSLKSLLTALIKIDSFFSFLLFEKANSEISTDLLNSNIHNDISLNVSHRNTLSELSNSLNQASLNDNISNGSYKNVQISNIIKNANIGNLLILNCGHEGLFTAKELEMYSMYLLNSRFIS